MRTTENHTETITEANAAADAARMALTGAVVRARLGGWSWAEIAAALGTSKQTAYNRYNGYIPTHLSPAAAAALATGGTPADDLPPAPANVKKAVQAPAPARNPLDDAVVDVLAGELPGQTTIEDAGHPNDDPARRAAFRAGDLDTAGNAVDWTQEKPRKCPFCECTGHWTRGTPGMFWLYPGCRPTTKDAKHRTL